MRPHQFLLIMLSLVVVVNSVFQLLIFISFTSPSIKSQISDENLPIIRDNSIEFNVSSNPKELSFTIKSNCGYSADSLYNFCDGAHCTLPLVFGGPQTLQVHENGRILLSFNFESPLNRIKCTSSTYDSRECHLRSVCYDGSNLTMNLPYRTFVESPLAVLGARPPPSDKKRDRVYGIITSVSGQPYPDGSVVHNSTSYLASTYYNTYMLWHSLFDFTLPLFYSISKLNMENENMTLWLSPSSDMPPMKILKSFVKSIEKIKENDCFEDLYIGMSKVKTIGDNQAYSFPNNFTSKLRRVLFPHLNISEVLSKKPQILLLGRKTNSRVITNSAEVIEMIRSQFGQYEVKEEYFEDLPIEKQIETSYQSDIFIGIHGSGLSHVAWMRPGTSLIEIMPYKFWCRDWYEKACAVSGVRYFKYEPASEDESPNATVKAKNCWKKPLQCESSCLSDLRDQNVKVNINVLKKLMSKVINKNI